jgi:toxin ParE1/3/4
MSKCFVSTRAQADLDETWLYVSRDRPKAADRLIDRLVAHFELLASNPDLGEALPTWARDLRQSVVGRYVVLYRVRPDRVEIIRVIHGARNVAEEFGKHWFS